MQALVLSILTFSFTWQNRSSLSFCPYCNQMYNKNLTICSKGFDKLLYSTEQLIIRTGTWWIINCIWELYTIIIYEHLVFQWGGKCPWHIFKFQILTSLFQNAGVIWSKHWRAEIFRTNFWFLFWNQLKALMRTKHAFFDFCSCHKSTCDSRGTN